MARVLIITGMHRSGTSLVASLFERAGIHLGARLLAPQADNPFGFFEDVEFVNFHEDALRARGQNILVPRDFALTPDAAEKQRARELIAARASHALWGWKDPRTSLTLDFWNALIPDARFLFVYRHPFDVILSLARRDEVVGFDFFNALDAWCAYNESILKFARAHPDTTLRCNTYALLEQIELFQRALAQKFSLALELTAQTRDELYRAEHLHRAPRSPESDALLKQIHPDAAALYDELQTGATPRAEETIQNASPEISALAQFAARLPAPLNEANQRALLIALVALTDPALYENFARTHVTRTNELENQRRAWEQTAQERAQTLQTQTAWATRRMRDLERLESNAMVRALMRLGIAPRSATEK